MAVTGENIQYQDFKKVAANMRAKGQSLKTDLNNAYTEVGKMSKDWYGSRYNSLVEQFQKLQPKLDEIIKIVITDLPYAIEEAARNYEKFESGSAKTTATKTNAGNITKLNKSSQPGMRFMETDVKKCKNMVEDKFKAAKKNMTSIEDEFKKITWQSNSATVFKTKFSTLKGDIDEALGKIITDFDTLITDTITDIKNVESANTVS